MLGDSITAGGHWQAWTGRADIINEGIGGNTSRHVLDRIDQVTWPSSGHLCFLMVGINDIGGGAPQEEIVENIESILLEIGERNITPILQSVLLVGKEYPQADKVNGQIKLLNETLEELALRQEIAFLDLNEVLTSEGFLIDRFTQDGIHLVEAGYKQWIDQILPIIDQHGI